MFDWFYHPPEKFEPLRPLATGALAMALVNFAFVIGMLLLWPGNVLDLNLGLGVGAFVTALYARFVAPNMIRSSKFIDSWEMDAPKAEPTTKFCKDCGKTFAMRQRQDGFDPATGRPKLTYELGCPDGDPTRVTAAYQRWLLSGMPRYSDPPRSHDWPECGKTKHVPLAPVGHLDHEPGDVSTECPKCIDQMLNDGIIGAQDAKKLVSALGTVK